MPDVYPEWLGDRAFTRLHGSRFAYVVGEMARGIATPHMVVEAVRAGLVGLSLPPVIDDAIARVAHCIAPRLRSTPCGGGLFQLRRRFPNSQRPIRAGLGPLTAKDMRR